MRKAAVLFIVLFLLVLAACGGPAGGVGRAGAAGDAPGPPEASERAAGHEAAADAPGDIGDVPGNVDDLLADVDEVVHGAAGDRLIYHGLREVETASDLIVEAVAKGAVGQHVETRYSDAFGKEVPSSGHTKREIEVVRVHKGGAAAGDTLTLLESYYVWTREDGSVQLVTRSFLPPAVPGETYLLFLRHHEAFGGYWTVGDYQGRFSIPTTDVREKAEARTLRQADLGVYDHETAPYLLKVYYDAYDRYFRDPAARVPEEEQLRQRNERVKAVHDPDMTLERLKTLVPAGGTVEDAVRLLGDRYNREPGYATWEDVIRYDFTGDPDYRFLYDSIDADIFTVDHAGLESGKMRFQVFLFPDGDEVIRHAFIAYRGEDGRTRWLSMFPDGTVYDEAIGNP